MTVLALTMLFLILTLIGVVVYLYLENIALRHLIKEIETMVMKALSSLKQLLWLPLVEALSSTDDEEDDDENDETNETN